MYAGFELVQEHMHVMPKLREPLVASSSLEHSDPWLQLHVLSIAAVAGHLHRSTQAIHD